MKFPDQRTFAAAWRRAVVVWLRRQPLIYLSVAGPQATTNRCQSPTAVSPSFSKMVSLTENAFSILILGIAFSLFGCCSPQQIQHGQLSDKPCVYHHDPGLKDSPGLFPFIDLMERNAFYLGMSISEVKKVLGKRLVMTNFIEQDGQEIAYVDLSAAPFSGTGQPRKDTWVARFYFDKRGKLTLYYVTNERRWKSGKKDHPE